jgi:hypothetical protein
VSAIIYSHLQGLPIIKDVYSVLIQLCHVCMVKHMIPRHTQGNRFIRTQCKRRAEDLLNLSRHQLKVAVAVVTGHAAVRGHLHIMGLFDGIQPADSAGCRLQQCSVLSAAARCWFGGAIIYLGTVC